jgi:hypothetical protein
MTIWQAESVQVFGHLEGFERFMQPGSPFLVLVAVADKSAVFKVRRHVIADPWVILVA